jgi:hypothetical protein
MGMLANEQWDAQRNYEKDYATVIEHKHIKKFCSELRKNIDNLNILEQILYITFIDNTISRGKCIPCLYEKICYIRDRSIYRPSFVITSNGKSQQTFLYVREEIDSLPSSDNLYEHIKKIYKAMLKEKDLYHFVLIYLWRSPLTCYDNDLINMGHSEDELKLLRSKYATSCDDDSSFNIHIGHLLELEDAKFIECSLEKFWIPLQNMWEDTIKIK